MELTEVADEMCLYRIRCPLSVDHLTALLNIKAHLLKTFGEVLIPALVLINGILPLPKALITVSDGRDERLQVPVELQHGLRIKNRHSVVNTCGHEKLRGSWEEIEGKR